MANYKWSDNSEFVPESSLLGTDYLMGLRPGSPDINIKVLGSTVFATNLNYNFVSTSGSNSNSGGVTSPFATIAHADGLNTQTLFITPGSYTDAAYAVSPVSWVGAGSNLVTYTITPDIDNLTLNNTLWSSTSTKLFKGVTISGEGINLNATTNYPNSAVYFDDVVVNIVTINNIPTVNFTDTAVSEMILTDVQTVYIDTDIALESFTWSANAITNNVNIIINNCPHLTAITLNNTGEQNVTSVFLQVTNCPTMTTAGTLQFNDASGGVFNMIFDVSSYPEVVDPVSGPAGLLEVVYANPFTGPLTVNQGISTGARLDEVKASTTYNTTSSLVAGDLVSGLVLSTPSSNITLTMPAAANIVSAMTAATIFTNSTFTAKIVNLSSTYTVTLHNPDVNLLTTGLTTSVISPGQTMDLEFSVTDTSTPQVSIYGGNIIPSLSGYAPLASPTFTGIVKGQFLQFSGAIFSTTIVCDSTLISSPYSSAGALASTDIIGGIVLANPTVPITLTLPTFTAFEAALASILNVTTVPVNTFKFFSVENLGTATVTFGPGTNFTIATQNGTPIVASYTPISFKAVKSSSSTYTLFGV